MVGIATRWQASRKARDIDDPMEDAADDDPTLSSSSSSIAPPSSSVVPPSSGHFTMSIDEAHAHYMDMVREEWVARAVATYNHHLLHELLQEEEELDAGRVVACDVDLVEQEALLVSYRFARKIRLAR
ncbi:Peroxisomal biogenesis factor 3 [Hordeum vulgare]|nr:Peroxisomal biogenesis factor 3 [Hordeum vulgare]